VQNFFANLISNGGDGIPFFFFPYSGS